MPELRYSVINREWVIIATERAKRPEDFSSKPAAASKDTSASCPFCPGKESSTPKEVFAIRDQNTAPDTDNWKVRVIPNAFPALSSIGEPTREKDKTGFQRMNGVGIHEVIIESPEHEQIIATMDPVQVENIFAAYKQRYETLSKDPRFESVILFKNHGENAGTSLHHPHSQVVASPVTPDVIRSRIDIAREHYNESGTCLYCDLSRMEKEDGRRMILETDHFIVFSPYASRFPFETWIMPKEHASNYVSISAGQNRELAGVMQKTLKKLHAVLNNPSFNYAIYSSPFKEGDLSCFHWNIKIFPRLTKLGGFEIGSGIVINTMVPEMSARSLREA